MKHSSIIPYKSLTVISLTTLMGFGSTAQALVPVEVPETWGGDISTRPRLTVDWGGVRDEMGKKGAELDANMFLLPGGVVSGGRNTGAEFWGNVDYTLNIDTDKLGLSQ